MLKRKLILFMCSLLVILNLCSCGKKDTQSNKPQDVVNGSAITIENQQETLNENNQNKKEINNLDEPSKEELEKDKENINIILPLLDTTTMCMKENNYEFNTKSKEFIWNELFYFVSNYNQNYDEMKIEDNYCKVNETILTKIVKSFGLSELPKYTKELSFINKNNNTYEFMLGDRGNSKLELVSFSKNKDNTFDVEVNLILSDDNSIICKGFYHLKPIENAFFPFEIIDGRIEESMGNILSGQIKKWKDEHTIQILVKNELQDFQVTDDKIVKILKDKSIGDYIDFTIKNEIIVSVLN